MFNWLNYIIVSPGTSILAVLGAAGSRESLETICALILTESSGFC